MDFEGDAQLVLSVERGKLGPICRLRPQALLDGGAILDREADLASRQGLQFLSIVSSKRWADPNSSVPSNTILHRIDILHEESAPCCETP
jgi:hypothetical protein